MTDTATPLNPPRPRKSRLRASLKGMNPSFVIGATILCLVVLIALLAPVIFPGNPMQMRGMPGQWPFTTAEFPLGTDALGRNVIAQLAYGARITLLVGFAAAILSLAIGITIGAAAGYYGGATDAILVRLTEIFQTVPSFLLVIVIVAIGESSSTVIALAIGVASWPSVARLVRAQFRSLRSMEYITAARCLGFSTPRIVFGEILPNAMAPIVVTTTVMVANAILTEAGLSFLNLGDVNVVSWGGLIGDGRDLIRREWYLSALPGAAISITVLGLNLMGTGLNDMMNPRNRK